MQERKRIVKFAGGCFLATLSVFSYYSDAHTGSFWDISAKMDVKATAIAQENPQTLNNELIGLPEDVIENSTQISLYYLDEENNSVVHPQQGSGMLVEEIPGYKVFLTARHVIVSQELNSASISGIITNRPHFDSGEIIYAANNIWAFIDKSKDMGIIIINDSNYQNKIKIPVSNETNKKLFGITYPDTGVEYPGFIVYKPTVVAYFSDAEVDQLLPSTFNGASGSVLCNSNGEIDSVVTTVGATSSQDNPVAYSVKVGDTLQNLLNQASQELGVNF
ncbi:MAG TPA: hypothetical protein VG895_00990 [Patescibacteria group bacterium]|nr:hypothetical protein [Patescibacteria group bacterium]